MKSNDTSAHEHDSFQRLLIWLSVLTGALMVLIIGVIVGLAALSSDVAQLDQQVTALKFNGVSPSASTDSGSAHWPAAGSALRSTATPSGAGSSNFKAQIDSLKVVSRTLEIGLTVQFSGPADLLYQPPIVRGAQGRVYSITSDSLKAARFAFLDLTTSGQATARFTFQPAPAAQEALALVFNPEMPIHDAVAPRVEVVLRNGE
jgi:hypothetical protein